MVDFLGMMKKAEELQNKMQTMQDDARPDDRSRAAPAAAS